MSFFLSKFLNLIPFCLLNQNPFLRSSDTCILHVSAKIHQFIQGVLLLAIAIALQTNERFHGSGDLVSLVFFLLC